MKAFRFIFAILMIITFAAVLAGAHHQITIFLISGICYAVFDNEIKKEAKNKTPFPKTFNIDKL